MAVLKGVLSPVELKRINKILDYDYSDYEIQSLKVGELSKISIVLINSEYGGKIPPHQTILPAIALEILINRAYKKNLVVF